MKNLVRRINTPVICDTYTCNNMAEFEISHEVVRAASMQVCPECLRAIVEQGAELLGMDMCKCDACADSEESLPFDEPDAIEQTTETNEPQEESKYSEKNLEKISESGKNTELIISAEDTEPVKTYTCKHCGTEFTDLKTYRGHILNCGKKSKER
nr:MAG TPA: C2H2 type zinc-finger protein [Caudoviricetes sp.]